MKKLLLLLIIVCGLQAVKAQKTSFGIKGGLNYTSFHGSNEVTSFFESIGSGFKYKAGFHAGIFVKVDLSNRFYLQPELLISSQGSKQKNENIDLTDAFGNPLTNSLDVRINTNLVYIALPLMGKYYVDENFSIEFGPQLGYMLSGKINNKVTNDGGLSDEILDNFNAEGDFDIENTNDLDFGINLGVGYDLTNELGIGIRYNYGLTKNFGDGSPLKNSVFQLSFGYSFN